MGKTGPETTLFVTLDSGQSDIRVGGVPDYADRYGDAFPRLAKWHQEGKLKYRETVAEGIENAASAFLGIAAW